MKKLIFTVVLMFVGWSIIASAQDVKKTDSQFKPGWYLGLNGGINWFLGEGNNVLDATGNHWSFAKSMGYLGRLEAGYQFNPIYALRGMVGFNQFNHYTQPTINGVPTDGNNLFTGETLSADLLMNITNLTQGYSANRKLSLSAFAGLGLAYMNENSQFNNLAGSFLRGGLQGNYNITPALALNLIAELNIQSDNTNDMDGGLFFDMSPDLSLGLAYRLPEKVISTPVDDKLPIKDTEPVVEPVVTPVVKDSTPVVVPDVKPDKTIVPVIVQPEVTKTEVETAVDYLNEHIYFAINNRTPDTNEYDDEMKVIAKYVQQHPDVQIIVRGYADRGTGNIEVNNLISKQRAVNVANTLIRKYGVPYKNIWVRWYGGAIQPYNKNAKNNRLVIVHTPEVKQLVPARGADQKKNK